MQGVVLNVGIGRDLKRILSDWKLLKTTTEYWAVCIYVFISRYCYIASDYSEFCIYKRAWCRSKRTLSPVAYPNLNVLLGQHFL